MADKDQTVDLRLTEVESRGTERRVAVPVEFHFLREARSTYGFDQDLFQQKGDSLKPNFRDVHELAMRVNSKRDLSTQPELTVRPGQLLAVALIHRILYHVLDSYQRLKNPHLREFIRAALEHAKARARERPAGPRNAASRVSAQKRPGK